MTQSSDDEILQAARRISTYGVNPEDLDIICPPNRWAAFTDDELESIAEAIERTFGEHEQSPTRPMIDELETELARRKD